MKYKIVFLLSILLLSGCRHSDVKKCLPVVEKTDNPGIKELEHKWISNIGEYSTVEIDNHLYGVVRETGIIHLESCPCKLNYKIEKEQKLNTTVNSMIKNGMAVGDTEEGV